MNALEFVRGRSAVLDAVLRSARVSFLERFWRSERGFLADVVDVNHVAGAVDDALRPNQIFAVGGLPYALAPKQVGLSIVETVERELWTPMGLRTLSPRDPRYCANYAGGPNERDGAYHQGPAWLWLVHPFVDAWLRVRGDTPANRRIARTRFLAPLAEAFESCGLGHLPEVAGGDAPHRPGGCPFQAWSLSGYLLASTLCATRATAKPKLIKP